MSTPASLQSRAVLPRISIVLPAYNERENLPTMIERAEQIMPRLVDDYEVILVDDGSRDGTREVATELMEENYPTVRVAVHDQNRGYGAAIRTGFAHAQGDLVFYTDSDNQFDLGDLEHFLPLMDEWDLIVGFRVYRYDTVMRSMLSWVYNRIVRVLFRVRVRDVDCAFKLFRREVLEKITIESDDFFVDAELVAKARKWNFRLLEKGVRHYPRVAGETTVRVSDIPETLKRIGLMWKRIYYPGQEHLRRVGRGTRPNTRPARRSCRRSSAPRADWSRYVEERFYAEYAAIQDRHWWFVGRRRVIGAVLEAALPANGRPSRRILDIGCGTGTMLGELRRFGDVFGVDADEAAVQFCHSQGETQVQLASGGEVPHADASFDLVALLDVIEHVDNDQTLLAEARRVLVPRGSLFVTVPAYEWMWGPQDEIAHHKRRYTRPQLRDSLACAGYRVDRASYFNTFLFPPIAAIRVGPTRSPRARRGQVRL